MVTLQSLDAPAPKGVYELICQVEVDGALPVKDWLEDLKSNDLHEVYAAFDKLDDEVLRLDPWRQMGQWFKPLRNFSNVWQVSSSRQRVLGFRERTALVLTNGFYKTGGETPQKHIRKSVEIQKRFKNGA